ncbi:uncharacterized protein LOC121202073 isoform X2 [Betta splendens]|uniref:Uncharacterized protein LOC121202073 isoform X2 n=1 Tax=Betta splendens TaxID=158456 RepID=A0A9W2XLZ0_BETSP|nr:uncharacterized protein LOC121202073 isoform X2 [Betta splendens]
MEYATIIVKWAHSSLPHVNMVTDHVHKWYTSHWVYHEKAELTLICVQIAPNHVVEYTKKLLAVISNLWSDSPLFAMEMSLFEELLKMKNPTRAHKYSIMHTGVRPGQNFRDHITDTKAVIRRFDWTLKSFGADNETIMKLTCPHKPHSVTVMLPGSQMIIMKCQESQRICDLMKTYDIVCSSVCDSKTALSGRAPCMALVNHEMEIVYIDKTPYDDKYDEKPKIPKFHNNMVPIKMRTKRSLLRYNPYHVPARRETSDSPDDDIEVIVYCESIKSSVNAAIQEDGRFFPNAQYRGPNGIFSEPLVQELQGDNHEIAAASPHEPMTDESDHIEPYACCICYKPSDAFLQCGHLYCNDCVSYLLAMSNSYVEITCSMCKQQSPPATEIEWPSNFSFKCNACNKKKLWVTNCLHLTCTCYGNGRCSVCNEAIAKLQKVFD